MKIKWLGHSCFLITSASGVKIIADPYKCGGMGLKYDKLGDSAHVVTASHGHGDHGAVDEVDGDPVILNSVGKTQTSGIDITGIDSYHDDTQGTQRGNNIIFCFDVDGIRVCHLGDLGHTLSDSQLADMGKVDVLLLPVGGKFTIDPVVATNVSDQVMPKVVIPMHVKNAKCEFVPYGIDDYTKGKTKVKQMDDSEIELMADDLIANTEIVILNHAR
ncbi:MAG: MBL fold metallo-hydrolase [Chloroflexi bacterium]|jgi:L-ascorbate metabolism protein UlaG (beta-lactamase superfamily)|nr:MBL fold metallo-hydrolase [Chloroflexota bacterium]MBT7081242.1 MBL fold metallo-hydrolase [Chloroflexota bacterium]MBT7288923.1 MBL fold metallo-hydrolase [Chloroflexota bacterium]